MKIKSTNVLISSILDKVKEREETLLKAKGLEAKVMNIEDHHQEEDFKNWEHRPIHTGIHIPAILLMVILQEEDFPLNLTCASLSQKMDSQFLHLGIQSRWIKKIKGLFALTLIDQLTEVAKLVNRTSMREII